MIKNPLLKALCIFTGFAFDSLSRLFPPGRNDLILVVRLDVVGDFFLWMRSGAVNISEYARAHSKRAVLLANPLWASYARSSGLWDEVIELSDREFCTDPVYRLRALIRIRRLGATQLIQTRASRVSLIEDSIARVCGIPRRISPRGTLFNQRNWERRLGDRCYEELVPIDERLDTHESRRNAQLAFALTGRPPGAFRFERPVPAVAASDIVIVLGAGDTGRAWPAAQLSGLISHIRVQHPQLSVTLLGLAAESETAAHLCANSGAGLQNLVGRTTLAQFVAHVAATRLVLCNESAAYQVALAYGTDILCFLGGGHYGHFVPLPTSGPAAAAESRIIDLSVPMSCFGCNWHCIYPRTQDAAYKCVADISLASAVRAVDTLLALSGTAPAP